VSDGGVHSSDRHLPHLLRLAAERGLSPEQVCVHAILDGRDTPPRSGAGYVEALERDVAAAGVGRIASVVGRYFAMDRDNRWDRTEKAYRLLTEAVAGYRAATAGEALAAAYERGENDEFVAPTVVQGDGDTVAVVADNDAVLFMNFRADRARQLTRAFVDRDFSAFERRVVPKLADFVMTTEYAADIDASCAYPPESLSNVLGDFIAQWGKTQLRIAETEKYAHVTYFFNGGREEPFPHEERVLVPSPKDVATYDLKPEMSAYLVTEELMQRIENAAYKLIVLNFANGDMVGHSGIMAAAVKACEAVDKCLGQIVEKFTAQGGIVIITADHGNAETMLDLNSDSPITAHSSNPVPFILISQQYKKAKLRQGGSLRDIAPTILCLLNLPVPDEMTGRSLIIMP